MNMNICLLSKALWKEHKKKRNIGSRTWSFVVWLNIYVEENGNKNNTTWDECRIHPGHLIAYMIYVYLWDILLWNLLLWNILLWDIRSTSMGYTFMGFTLMGHTSIKLKKSKLLAGLKKNYKYAQTQNLEVKNFFFKPYYNNIMIILWKLLLFGFQLQ